MLLVLHNIEVIVNCDNDDETFLQYQAEIARINNLVPVQLIRNNNPSMTQATNHAAKLALAIF